MRRRGFTLIELLVVILILVVLAGLLFPVYARARMAARQAGCLSNLRQIHVAASMYVADADDVLPIPRMNTPRLTWAGLVHPYVKNWSVFRCPNMVDASFGGKSIWDAPLPGNVSMWPGYGWNVDYLALAKSDCSDFDRQFVGSGPPVGLSAVADPAGTVMCTGISLEPGGGSWAGRNSLHPEWGGYHLAPAPATVGDTDTCTFPYAGWGQGSYLGPYGGFEVRRHGGRGSVLFLDGHAKSMLPEQLAAGTNWTPGTPNTQIRIIDRTRYLWDLQ
jgi:prepilin-type N-terminal cleavage/methylation domain-containing protein/prepilin-type processing-associated H-X9-DG protein